MKETTGKIVSLAMYLDRDRIEVEIVPNDCSGVKHFCIDKKNDYIVETAALFLSKKMNCDITFSYPELPCEPFLISAIHLK